MLDFNEQVRHVDVFPSAEVKISGTESFFLMWPVRGPPILPLNRKLWAADKALFSDHLKLKTNKHMASITFDLPDQGGWDFS